LQKDGRRSCFFAEKGFSSNIVEKMYR